MTRATNDAGARGRNLREAEMTGKGFLQPTWRHLLRRQPRHGYRSRSFIPPEAAPTGWGQRVSVLVDERSLCIDIRDRNGAERHGLDTGSRNARVGRPLERRRDKDGLHPQTTSCDAMRRLVCHFDTSTRPTIHRAQGCRPVLGRRCERLRRVYGPSVLRPRAPQLRWS